MRRAASLHGCALAALRPSPRRRRAAATAAVAAAGRRMRRTCFDAQTELLLDEPDAAQRPSAGPRARSAGRCAPAAPRRPPPTSAIAAGARGAADAPPRARRRGGARRRARRACARGSSARQLRRHRGRRAAGDAATARQLAAAARVPHGDALHAPGRGRDAGGARARRAAARRPQAALRRSRRTCSTPTRRACASCSATPRAAVEHGFPARRAEAAAQAAGYFADPRARATRRTAARPRRGADARVRARSRATAPRGGDGFAGRARGARRALDGFTAAPFTAEEAARRAQQLLRFLALVPVEYGRGVSGDEGHAATSRSRRRSRSATAPSPRSRDLAEPARQARPAPRPRPVAPTLDAARRAALERAAGRRATSPARRGRGDRRSDARERARVGDAAERGSRTTDESDYDLIALTLDRMEASAGAGQYRQAEQARLEAYAFFEFGPERRLKSLRPGPRHSTSRA